MKTKQKFIKTKDTVLELHECFDLSGGVDQYSSDSTIKAEDTPYATNIRVSNRSTVITAKGPSFYSTPIGETLNAAQTSVTGAADQTLGLSTYLAQKFTPSSTGRLTRVDLNLKNATLGTGPVMVGIYSDNAGNPGSQLALSSVYSSSITTTYAYVTARYILPALLTSGTAYWIVTWIQDDGSNTYQWSSTTGTNAKNSTNGGLSYAALNVDLDYKTYIATDSPVLGGTRYYNYGASTKTSLMAHGTSLYSINDITGATTAVDTGLNGSATDYFFDFGNDNVFYCNGYDVPRQYNGTVANAIPTSIPGTPPISKNIIMHKNRLWFMAANDPTRIVFSDPADYSTYQSTSFIYVPSPRSADPLLSWFVLQDNLYLQTRKTKYALYGSDLASFVLRKSTGLEGAVNQRVVQKWQNYAIYLSDNGVFMFNGATDTLISREIDPELKTIIDRTKCTADVQNNFYRLYYPSPGSSYNNKCLVYDLIFQNWYIDTDTPVGRTSVWGGSGDTQQLIQFSSIVGAGYYAEQGFDKMGYPIKWEYRSHYEYYGDPARKKVVKRHYPQFNSATSNHKVLVSYDKDYANSPITPVGSPVSVQGTGYILGSTTPTLGSIILGASQLTAPRFTISGDFKYLQHRFSRTGVGNDTELKGWLNRWYPKRAR